MSGEWPVAVRSSLNYANLGTKAGFRYVPPKQPPVNGGQQLPICKKQVMGSQ